MPHSQDSEESCCQPEQQSAQPVDWAQHYEEGNTPWDHGAAHPELVSRLQGGEVGPRGTGARALVPGCGRGHDAFALAQAGWVVTALDQVPALAEGVEQRLQPLGGRFERCDALAWGPEPGTGMLDLVFDHTFLCAIDRAQRPQFADLLLRTLRPGGDFICLVFPVGKPIAAGGPPHGLDIDQLLALLGDSFELVTHEPVTHSIPEREHGEHWARFVRRQR